MYGQSADRVNPMVQHLSRNTHHPSPAELGSPHYRSSGRHSFIEQPTRDTAITQTGADNWVTQKLHPWQPLLLTITSKNPGPAPPSFPFPPAIRGLSSPRFLHGLLSTAGAELSSSRAAPNPESWALLQAWSKLLPPHLPSSTDEINWGFFCSSHQKPLRWAQVCCLLVFAICSHRFHLAPCHFSLLAWVFPFA